MSHNELPDYGYAMWQRGEGSEFIFQDFPLKYLLKVAGIFSTATAARIESIDYLVQIAFHPVELANIKLLAPAESAEMIRVSTALQDPGPLFFPEVFLVAFCAVLPTVPEGYDVEKEGKLPFVVRGVFPPHGAPIFGTGKARSTKLICFADEARTVPMRWLKNEAEPGAVVDPPRLWKGGLIRVVSTGPGRVRPEIWDGRTWVSGGTLVDADQGVPADAAALAHFGVLPEPAVCSSIVPTSVSDDAELSEDQSDRYILTAMDRDLLDAAAVLLKKVAGADTLRPAQLVSVAKLQHTLSHLPRVTPNLDVTVSVVGPSRKFDEIETWHYWEVGIEGERLFLETGGHFYQPSTGGDSFTTMNWTAVPGQAAVCDDYSAGLWMVPDVETFSVGVAGIEFVSQSYRIEIVDSDNALLDVDGEADEGEEQDDDKGPSVDENDELSDAGARAAEPWSVAPLDDREKRLAAKISPAEVDANEPQHAYGAENCDFCGCLLIQRGLFVDGCRRGQLEWANICAGCFEREGDGIGWGRGQIYARQPNGDWRMVAGFQRQRGV